MDLFYVPVLARPKTFFVDIDGVILKQQDRWPLKIYDTRDFQEIASTVKLLNQLYTAGHKIVLTTARSSQNKRETKYQLTRIGLQYHELLMSLPTGQRVLINDRKPEEEIDTAVAINLIRDEGLTDKHLEAA